MATITRRAATKEANARGLSGAAAGAFINLAIGNEQATRSVTNQTALTQARNAFADFNAASMQTSPAGQQTGGRNRTASNQLDEAAASGVFSRQALDAARESVASGASAPAALSGSRQQRTPVRDTPAAGGQTTPQPSAAEVSAPTPSPSADVAAATPDAPPAQTASQDVPAATGAAETPVPQPTSQQLFEQIVAGQITPDPNNPQWTALYVNGQPTQAQIQAFNRWSDFQQRFNFTRPADMSPVDAANEMLNQGQQDDVDGAAGVPVRTTAEESADEALATAAQSFADISEDQLSLSDRFTKMRLDAGLPEKEARLNELTAQEDELNALRRKRVQDAREGLVATGVIAGRISEIERQEMERLDSVLRQKSALLNEINTANQNIETTLGLAQADDQTAYTRSVDALNFAFKANQTIADANQREFSNQLALNQALSSLPEGRWFEINGQRYEGMASDPNTNSVQFTDNNGQVFIIGYNKQTGEEVYRQFIGQGKVATAAPKSAASLEKEELAQARRDFRSQVSTGEIVGVPFVDDKGKTQTAYFSKTDVDAAQARLDEPGFFRNDPDDLLDSLDNFVGAEEIRPPEGITQ